MAWKDTEAGRVYNTTWQNSEAGKEYKRAWYAAHKEQRLKEQRIANQNARLAVLNKLGGKCAVCGWSDWRALQLDHIKGGGHQERILRKGNSWSPASYRRMLLDPELHLHFQVLCANHNWIKKYENNENTGRFKDREDLPRKQY